MGRHSVARRTPAAHTWISRLSSDTEWRDKSHTSQTEPEASAEQVPGVLRERCKDLGGRFQGGQVTGADLVLQGLLHRPYRRRLAQGVLELARYQRPQPLELLGVAAQLE